jgi:hypothetical protein
MFNTELTLPYIFSFPLSLSLSFIINLKIRTKPPEFDLFVYPQIQIRHIQQLLMDFKVLALELLVLKTNV